MILLLVLEKCHIIVCFMQRRWHWIGHMGSGKIVSTCYTHLRVKYLLDMVHFSALSFGVVHHMPAIDLTQSRLDISIGQVCHYS